jgi:hypothetical protein
MKARPRRVENRVAEELTKWFESHGLGPVQRIPAVGGRGPDITWNELGLVVDVKSRKKNPKSLQIADEIVVRSGKYTGVRLRDLDLLFEVTHEEERPLSRVLENYYTHMDAWRGLHPYRLPYGGLTAIILHWPGTNIDNSVLFAKESIVDRFDSIRSIQGPGPIGQPEGDPPEDKGNSQEGYAGDPVQQRVFQPGENGGPGISGAGDQPNAGGGNGSGSGSDTE